MGYQIPIFKEFVNIHKAEVHVVHWDHKKLTHYIPPTFNGICYYNKSSLNKNSLFELAENINPNIIYISGWMDKDYLSVVKIFKKKGIPIVAGLDDQWKGNLRQLSKLLLSRLLLSKYFSHGWVAGPYQYEFAKIIGFKNHQIIFNCLSADTNLFNNYFLKSIINKDNNYPHRFLYAGRLERVKGVDLLIEAWNGIHHKKKDWDLCIIGNGSLRPFLLKQNNIILKDFIQPEYLFEEINSSGCFILPSRSEKWGLVLHEYSAAGLPIICSDVCGAAPVFLTPKYNGFTFKANNVKALQNSMINIINNSDQDLITMARKSHKNGQKITPELSAASFLSLLNNNE